MLLPNSAVLKLNYMEMGALIGSIPTEAYDKLPRSLWLKLHIVSTKAYFKHDTLGKRAREDVVKFKKELLEIEAKEDKK